MKRVKEQLVEVTFLDHAMVTGDQVGPISCKAVGWLIGSDKQCIYLASWICNNEVDSSDTECFTIVKHKGLVVRRLR